jgi:hypothetical protein
VEHALDPQYARKLGVNLDDLLVSQPSSGEEALRICETLVRSNALDVIVLDSVAALVTKAELEGEIGDVTVGAQARLMSAALRKLTSLNVSEKAIPDSGCGQASVAHVRAIILRRDLGPLPAFHLLVSREYGESCLGFVHADKSSDNGVRTQGSADSGRLKHAPTLRQERMWRGAEAEL